MGCVVSRIDREERVQICKERKRLMKQLVGFRGEFADAQLAYLRALKNTGVTLRQFTESDSLELEDTPYSMALPPSPPPPLPPSPPPPPPFSPDLRDFNNNQKEEVSQQESIEISDDDGCTPPPPPVPNLAWDCWDPFGSSSPHQQKKSEPIEQAEEENWAETNTEFEEDGQEDEVVSNVAENPLPEKSEHVELVDDNSSMMSWHTKDTSDVAMVVWGSKKTMAGVVKELDDYFLKASAGGKEIAVLMDIKRGDTLLSQNFKDNKRKRCNSAKVFNALSWSWSSRSLQITRDVVESCDLSDPCRPGAHCITLEKLYVEEQRLYKEVKEEETTKLELERKSLLLQRQEEEDHDGIKTEKTRFNVETLQSDINCLQQSISRTCSSILKLIDEELHPQLVVLTSGLMHMWRTMYECHQVQNHISQQINHLTNSQIMDLNSDYHRLAATQLETEVTSWYNNFCKLMQSQQDYVRTLCRWIHLTDCLVDDYHRSHSSSVVHTLSEEWQLALDRLPDKVASQAIKSFLSAIHSILLQQAEEHSQQKKYAKLEKRLQKVMYSLAEMEKKLEGSFDAGDAQSLSPKHPLLVKRAKTEALKKRVENEKIKYLNSVQVSRAMILNHLKTGLPNVFQALMGFSSACIQTFEAINNRVKPTDSFDDGSQ